MGVTAKFKWDDRQVLSYLKDMTTKEFNAVSNAVDDVREDLINVAKDSAPEKTSKLVNSIQGTRRVIKGKSITLTVKAEATNQGFDYAEWTHNADYRLGRLSRLKPGGRSRFGKSFTVGKGYLQNVLDGLSDDYVNHIKQAIYNVVNSRT